VATYLRNERFEDPQSLAARVPGTSRPARLRRAPAATGRARVLPVEPPLLTFVWQRMLRQSPRTDERR
jgi:hypothetical protein